jgi:IS4 transposase
MKELLKDKNKYKFVPHSTSFDYLPKTSSKADPVKLYKLNFRIVRFKITDDSYETVLTNLDSDLYSPEKLKALYAMRWGIETSFRDLKYTIGMLYFHSSNQELIRQEIYASLILYNYCQLIANNNPPDCKDKWKWKYKPSFKAAVTNTRRYMSGDIDERELVLRIKKFLIPIRPGRSYSRNVRPQSAKTPSYYTA